MNFLLVFVGGGMGSMARFAMAKAIGRMISSDFPWHTLSINILGALLIGALTECFAQRISLLEPARLFLVTGFLGGFTTFSAFSLESALMWEKGDYLTLTGYVIASVIGTVIAVFCGGAAVKAIL